MGRFPPLEILIFVASPTRWVGSVHLRKTGFFYHFCHLAKKTVFCWGFLKTGKICNCSVCYLSETIHIEVLSSTTTNKLESIWIDHLRNYYISCNETYQNLWTCSPTMAPHSWSEHSPHHYIAPYISHGCLPWSLGVVNPGIVHLEVDPNFSHGYSMRLVRLRAGKLVDFGCPKK